jgi:hypothetical protein
LHGIIFMSGFGRPFLGGAADLIDLRKNEEGPVMNDPKAENFKAENLSPAKPKSQSREPRQNNTPAMAGLAIAAVLLVVGLWLAHELRAASKMQDCVMTGSTNCNVIQP